MIEALAFLLFAGFMSGMWLIENWQCKELEAEVRRLERTQDRILPENGVSFHVGGTHSVYETSATTARSCKGGMMVFLTVHSDEGEGEMVPTDTDVERRRN